MYANRAWPAGPLVGLLLTVLGSWGVWELAPGLEIEVRICLNHTLDLLLLLGYPAVERWIERWVRRRPPRDRR